MEEIQGPPHVTALIVSRNCAGALRCCLEALENSTARESLEILVVDNGSSDGTAAILDDFPAVTTLKLPKNFGKTKALNIGLRTAKGELVFFMDPEVEVRPDTIARLSALIDADEAIGAVCPYIESAYPLPSPSDLKKAWRSGTLAGAQRIDPAGGETAVDYPMNAPMLVRRRFLKGMNYFDQHFGEHWADLELSWQLRSAGKTILVIPSIQVSMSDSGKAAFDNTVDMSDSATGAAAYISKHYGSGAGIGFRLSAMMHALASFNFKLLAGVVSGAKIDGTQA